MSRDDLAYVIITGLMEVKVNEILEYVNKEDPTEPLGTYIGAYVCSGYFGIGGYLKHLNKVGELA